MDKSSPHSVASPFRSKVNFNFKSRHAKYNNDLLMATKNTKKLIIRPTNYSSENAGSVSEQKLSL